MDTNIDPLAPTIWDGYIGQKAMKSRLDVYIDAALEVKPLKPLPHILLAGESGFGKSTLARLIAHHYSGADGPFYSLTMPMKPAALAQFFHRFTGGVVLFDEVHRLTKAQQEDLLDPLGPSACFTTPNGRRLPIPWFSAVLATTEPQALIEPLRRRIPINHLSFDPYTDEDLAAIVSAMSFRLGFDFDDFSVAEGLGRAAGGRPGAAVPLVHAAQALSNRGDTSLEAILDFCQVDFDGVTKAHRELLVAIDRLGGISTVGMDRLTDYTGLHSSVIRGLERLLIDRDLLSVGGAGRELTAAGVARLRERKAA